ncbi:MAG: hypothetical protein LAO03_06015 [Acidobacteriia bacterium]|nr:hypothetical protein [Terriglobia bacterium]
MRARFASAVFAALLLTLGLSGCGGGSGVSNQPPPPPPNGTKIPLMDMTASSNYLGFAGGLYENNTNTVPTDHNQAGLATVSQVVPRDASGNPSPNGKVVFLSIGMSNANFEFGFFQNQIATDNRVNHTTLDVENGAQPGVTACFWTQTSGVPAGCDPPDPAPICPTPDVNPYDIVRDCVLTPAGLTEAQVQVAWFKQADKSPGTSGKVPLCDASQPGCVNNDSTDALHLERLEGEILRAAQIRYPNLKQVFIASRIYGGYATITLNPEPFAYESGFTVKWLIQAQINQERGDGPDAVAGDLSYTNGKAPWIAWGPYIWANGPNPRSDGLTWCDGQPAPPCNGEEDFRLDDHTHPNPTGQQKVSTYLLNFFLSSPYTPWFRP